MEKNNFVNFGKIKRKRSQVVDTNYSIVDEDSLGNNFYEKMDFKIRMFPDKFRDFIRRFLYKDYKENEDVNLRKADILNPDNEVEFSFLRRSSHEILNKESMGYGSLFNYDYDADYDDNGKNVNVKNSSLLYIGFDPDKNIYTIDILSVDDFYLYYIISPSTHVNLFKSSTLEMLIMFVKQLFGFDSSTYFQVLKNKRIYKLEDIKIKYKEKEELDDLLKGIKNLDNDDYSEEYEDEEMENFMKNLVDYYDDKDKDKDKDYDDNKDI